MRTCPNWETTEAMLDRISADVEDLRHFSNEYALDLTVDKDELYTAMEYISDLLIRAERETSRNGN